MFLTLSLIFQCSVKNCTIPFHVTCAFEHSLEMKTILDEGDEVKFKSYCLKHSKPKAGEAGLSPACHKPPTETEKLGLRAQKLQELEEEFYTLVHPEEVARDLGLPISLLDFIFQYWKMKRKSNFNKALLPPKEDEENLLLQPQEDSIHTRMRMFMHLRQDLERVGTPVIMAEVFFLRHRSECSASCPTTFFFFFCCEQFSCIPSSAGLCILPFKSL